MKTLQPLVWCLLLLSGCAASTPSEELSGPDLAVAKNCVSCHTVSGAPSVGPTWRSLAGTEVTLEDGREVLADADYLATSMLRPQDDIVEGFTTVAMPTIELTDAEVAILVAYIESLRATGALG